MNYKFRKLLYEDATNNSFEERVAYAKQQLQNGADPEDVFDEVDYDLAIEGFVRVALDDKWNFIDIDYNILCDDLWFDNVQYFHNGFAPVLLDDRGWNFIDTDGNILREDLWFDYVESFHDGFDYAWAELNGKDCKIDTNSNLYDEKGNPIDNVSENKRRTVRLTESQLRNTIKRVVAQCLKEGRIR